jgi:DivIVA domain-containing protein
MEGFGLALDRQSIEKRDFPIGRRGYEPEAVDAHLERLADEVDRLKRQQRPRAESLASAASEQVRAIVEAAESSAAAITRQAEDEARRLAEEAAHDAEEARGQAIQQSREHVQRVAEASAVMVQRVDTMESELGALVESLRTGVNRLSADLALLQGNMGDLRSVAQPPAAAAAAPTPAFAPREPLEPLPPAPGPVEAAPPGPSFPDDLEPPPAPGGEGDSEAMEGARLIALNMALNGTPRDETDRYLAENFDLSDRGAILDEVYARVEG